MRPMDVYRALIDKGVDTFHHASTVTTSLSLLQLGGLASRHLVEQHGLPQTDQYTDGADRAYGIWNHMFGDTVDIHARISRPNHYGPVLFKFDVRVLANLSDGSDILVTKSNPSNWRPDSRDDQRYFMDPNELAAGLIIGDFGQMLAISTPNSPIPFDPYLQAVVLDEPRHCEGDSQEYAQAANTLNVALTNAGLAMRVTKRPCRQLCRCKETYANSNNRVHRVFSVP